MHLLLSGNKWQCLWLIIWVSKTLLNNYNTITAHLCSPYIGSVLKGYPDKLWLATQVKRVLWPVILVASHATAISSQNHFHLCLLLRPLQYSPEEQASPLRQYTHINSDKGRVKTGSNDIAVFFPKEVLVFRLLQHIPLYICVAISVAVKRQWMPPDVTSFLAHATVRQGVIGEHKSTLYPIDLHCRWWL